MVAGSSTRHTRARRQLGNNNKMFPCDWFKGEPLISAPAIFRFRCVMGCVAFGSDSIQEVDLRCFRKALARRWSYDNC